MAQTPNETSGDGNGPKGKWDTAFANDQSTVLGPQDCSVPSDRERASREFRTAAEDMLLTPG